MFDKFPFSNVHELNLDWILTILIKLKGGTKDQVLTRLSNKPLDFGWKTMSGGGGGGGTSDYDALGNKPSINGVTLEGNKTSTQLNIPAGPELANTMPLMNGTPQIGNSSRAAKADHVHPRDSTKASMVDVRAEINRAFNQYDPADAVYAPPYAAGTLGYAIENAAIAPEDIQDAVDAYLDAHPALTGMFTNAAKNALIALLEKVAYVDGNGQQYLNELITNLTATVTSIDAVFTQGTAVVYDTDSLDTLKQYLVVTASYSDETSAVVSGYELSGTLTVGTSTITASFGGQTDTFTVTVTDYLSTLTFNNVPWARMGTTSPYNRYAWHWTSATSTARAGVNEVVTNNNYTFTVTDSTKYNIVVYGFNTNVPETFTYNVHTGDAYEGDTTSVAPSWSASASSNKPYLAITLKKMDNTDFTAEELTGAYGIVFTATRGS